MCGDYCSLKYQEIIFSEFLNDLTEIYLIYVLRANLFFQRVKIKGLRNTLHSWRADCLAGNSFSLLGFCVSSIKIQDAYFSVFPLSVQGADLVEEQC